MHGQTRLTRSALLSRIRRCRGELLWTLAAALPAPPVRSLALVFSLSFPLALALELLRLVLKDTLRALARAELRTDDRQQEVCEAQPTVAMSQTEEVVALTGLKDPNYVGCDQILLELDSNWKPAEDPIWQCLSQGSGILEILRQLVSGLLQRGGNAGSCPVLRPCCCFVGKILESMIGLQSGVDGIQDCKLRSTNLRAEANITFQPGGINTRG